MRQCVILRGARRLGAFLALIFSVMRVFAQNPPAPPPNDHLADAIEVAGSEFTLTANLAGATAEAFEPEMSWITPLGYAGTRRTAWWSWVAPATGYYAWSQAAEAKPALVTVLSAAGDGGLVQQAGSYWQRVPSAYTNGVHFQLVTGGLVYAEAGRRYWIQLDIPRDLNVTGGLRDIFVHFRAADLARPANDSFAQRLSLNGTNAVLEADLLRATPDAPDVPGLPNTANATAWWRWRAPGPGTLVLRSRETNQPPVAALLKPGLWGRREVVRSSATRFGNSCITFFGARPELRWDTRTDEDLDILLDRHPLVDARVPAVFDLVWLPAPPNDELAGALRLEGHELAQPVSNESATTDGAPRWEAAGLKSVWFAWRPAVAGITQLTTNEPAAFVEPSFEILPPGGGSYGSEFQHLLSGCTPLRDLDPLPPFIPRWEIFIAGTTPGDLTGLVLGTNGVWFQAQTFWDYRIRLTGVSNSWGATTLRLRHTGPPANDLLINRIVLPSAAVKVAGRTAGATQSDGEPTHVPGRSVWWEWRAPVPGAWALSPLWTEIVSGLPGETRARYVVYRGTRPDAAQEAVRSEGPEEPRTFTAAGGETFLIGVFGADFGNNVAFALTEAASPALAIGPPRWTQSWEHRDVPAYVPLALAPSRGLHYVLEASTNLVHWTPLSTNRSYASPREAAPGWNEAEAARFFRTRLLD